MGEPFIYPSDTSRLVSARPTSKTMKLIYEPLTPVITDDSLRPYVYLLNDVAFHWWWLMGSQPTSEAAYHAKYRWSARDRIESEGQLWELVSAKCVYHQPAGQWAMCWTARRAVDGAEPYVAADCFPEKDVRRGG